MNELKLALQEAFPSVDFDAEKTLVDSGIVDSLSMVMIISIIEEKFDVSVTMEYIQPEYFQSVETMWEMIEELQ
jgi:acyl carrier protein